MTATTTADGLRDVVIGPSEICDVRASGQLFYRGYDIHDLANNASFEEVVFLLWMGNLPSSSELSHFQSEISEACTLNPELISLLRSFPRTANTMDVLRTVVSAMGMWDADSGDNSHEANLRKSLRIQSKIGTVVAAFERISQGQEPISPNPKFNLATNFLYMIHGSEPDPLYAKAMDTDFILHADHEINASTFATRVTVATGADLYSGMVSGIGTLSGPKHGGAAEDTMKMLLEIGSVENVDDYVIPRLTGSNRVPVPGFGHAVYRAPDPRASHLREMSHELGQLHNNTKWYDITTALERKVDELSNSPDRIAAGKQPIYANVDCFSASCYYEMGLPVRLFIPMFAISRTSGWCAHMMEQITNKKIIRPRAEYVGERERHYLPVAGRV